MVKWKRNLPVYSRLLHETMDVCFIEYGAQANPDTQLRSFASNCTGRETRNHEHENEGWDLALQVRNQDHSFGRGKEKESMQKITQNRYKIH